MLLSIRGTNGSGKSTVINKLLAQFPHKPIYGVCGPKKPEAYVVTVKGVKEPVYVLGSYHVVSGGCDQIQPYDLILDLLEKYSSKGHVLFEGVIVSSSYGRVGRYMERFGQQAVMAFMATTLDQCIANVKKRRSAREDAREFDPHNLTSKFNQIVKSRAQMEQEGKLRVVELAMEKAPEQVLALLRGAS